MEAKTEHCLEKHMVNVRKVDFSAKATVLTFRISLERGLIRPMLHPHLERLK